MSSVLAYNSKSILATSDSFPVIMSHGVWAFKSPAFEKTKAHSKNKNKKIIKDFKISFFL